MAYLWEDQGFEYTGEQQKGTGLLNITRTGLLTPMTALPELFADCLGGFRVLGHRIIRVPPHRHPLFTWARCVKVNAKPWEGVAVATAPSIIGYGSLNRIALSTKCDVTMNYSLPDAPEETEAQDTGQGDEQQEIALAGESWDYGYKNLTLPNHYLKWKSSDAPIRPDELNVYITQPFISAQIVRHRVIRKPTNAIMALMNTINTESVRLVSDVYPAGTVRFDGVSATRQLTTAKGLQFFELTYKFFITGNYGVCADVGPDKMFAGWNRAYNPAIAKYDSVVWQSDPTQRLFKLDQATWQQTINGRDVKGFSTLFHPLAI